MLLVYAQLGLYCTNWSLENYGEIPLTHHPLEKYSMRVIAVLMPYQAIRLGLRSLFVISGARCVPECYEAEDNGVHTSTVPIL